MRIWLLDASVNAMHANSLSNRRVLFIAHDVTLAHLGRVLSLAEVAQISGYDVTIACSPRIHGFGHGAQTALRLLVTVDASRFQENIAAGRPVFSADQLQLQFEEDIAILEECKPDLVVGDFRLTLSLSARRKRVPYATITNAYWCPWVRPRFTVPELPIVRWCGLRLGQRLFDIARPLAFRLHARPMQQLCKRLGARPYFDSLPSLYTEADFTLFSDLPEFYDGLRLPTSCGFLGPVEWSPSVPMPDWWPDLAREIPTAYVCMGSSGDRSILPKVISALSSQRYQIIVAGESAFHAPERNIFASSVLPGARACARADLVICNGGSPSVYQALAAGKPVLGIPSNLDQHLNMEYAEKYGAALSIRSGAVSPTAVTQTTFNLAHHPAYSARADHARKAIAAHDYRACFRGYLARILRPNSGI